MWTDGSDNVHTNFAINSQLEGDKCCVKTGAAGWRGEHCDGLLYGVCQYELDTDQLMSPVQFRVTPLQQAVSLSWSACHTCGGWRPSHVSLTACNIGAVGGQQGQQAMDCVQLETDMARDGVVITGLLHFSEYEVKLDTKLDYFNVSSASMLRARTSKFY